MIPFVILVTIQVLIDPFNYFSEENNKELLKLKENISQNENGYLYKLIKYDRNPCSIIILGDSKMNLLSPTLFEKYDKEKVANLAIGGGNLQDAIEIFRYISGKHNIKKIYWGVSLEVYNGRLLRNRAKPSIDLKNSLLLYLLNRYTFSSTMLICRSIIFNEQIDRYKPPFSKDEFWQIELDYSSRHLRDYSYPENYYSDFKKIANYCLEKNIKLVFVICPTYIDLQNKIHEFNLEEEYKRFKLDIESFGDVYDFDIPNIFTCDKNNFKDPNHCIEFVYDIVVQEIVFNKPYYSKYSKKSESN